MVKLEKAASVFLAMVLLVLTGCGSSTSGSASDPFAVDSTQNTAKQGTIFGNISTASGKTGLALTADRTTVDVDNGQVLVTAKLVNNGQPYSGVRITFSITAPTNGPATIEAGLTTVTTDSNGEAITRITTGHTDSTTNVIVSASAEISAAQAVTASTTFQIARGTGVITVGDLPVKSAALGTSSQLTQTFQQQIPIRLTDSNGNARVGVPVSVSVYSRSGSATVTFSESTISTDATGTAIFNATVTVAAPAANATVWESIVYKTATADPNPIVAYAAGYYSVTSTAVADAGILLTTDRTTIDVNNGKVLVTAQLTGDVNWVSDVGISGVPITFSILAPANGPATITPDLTTVTTGGDGTAVTEITTGNVLSTTNVIIQAAGTWGGRTITATTTFQIVRGGGVIMFTSAAGLEPGMQVNILDPVNKVVEPDVAPSWDLLQLIPFKLTDANSNPRVGVPVTISVYSITSLDPRDVTIDFLVPPRTEATQQTITTDSAGQGVFNAVVNLPSPAEGGASSVNVVYKAVTNDPIPVIAYVGGSYGLTTPPKDATTTQQ